MMNTETVRIITKRLRDMTAMANELNGQKNPDIFKLAQDEKYIRICGDSFRAVSLNELYPLCGADFNNKGDRKLSAVMNHFGEIKNPWKNEEIKPERRLQCWILREALSNKRNLAKLLNLSEHFDELLFCLDEVSIGDKTHTLAEIPGLIPKANKEVKAIVRCDLLAVGRKDREVFPVIIELKFKRDKKELETQLHNFTTIMNHKCFEDSFKALFESCSGQELTTMEPVKMIIWPELPRLQKSPDKRNVNRQTISELHKSNIIVIEYTLPYSFQAYVPNKVSQ